MRRYEKFLSKSIPEYIKNDHITEIVICDETGEDYDAITANFSHPKLKVFKNDSHLGCFKNKMNVAAKATSQYICIFDSDNYADENYFIAFKNFININTELQNTIFIPSYAKPLFNFNWISNVIITDKNINTIWEKYQHSHPDGCGFSTVLNTMNCIISKYFFDTINILDDTPWCNECFSYDSIYFCLYILFEKKGNLIVVPGMEYEHRVHAGSHYIQYSIQSENFYKNIKLRFGLENE
jgi:hypothetical protein